MHTRFAEVHLVVRRPWQRLLTGDPAIQATVQPMQEDGVVIEAWVACADKHGLADQIHEPGSEVKGMGAPLTEVLNDPDTQVMTFQPVAARLVRRSNNTAM